MDDFPQALRTMLADARVKQMPKGQIIFYGGDTPSEVYAIKSGTVKLYDIDSQGNEKILHIIKRPALLPFIFFREKPEPVQWFSTALTDCELYVMPMSCLQQKMKEDGAFALALANTFASEVNELLVRLSSLEKTLARNKLCVALRFLLVRHSERMNGMWQRVSFTVNHQLLADLSGITRESAAVAMKDLQKKGIVRSPRLGVLEIHFKKMVNLCI